MQVTKVLFGSVAFPLAMMACQPTAVAPTGDKEPSPSVQCYSADKILVAIADAGLTGETNHLKELAVTSDDLLKLQKLPPSNERKNRVAFDEQVANDIAAAIKRFRAESAPNGVNATKKGEFLKNAAIENIAPAVDQIRNSTVVYATPTGPMSLEIGALIKVNGCWKILYL